MVGWLVLSIDFDMLGGGDVSFHFSGFSFFLPFSFFFTSRF